MRGNPTGSLPAGPGREQAEGEGAVARAGEVFALPSDEDAAAQRCHVEAIARSSKKLLRSPA